MKSPDFVDYLYMSKEVVIVGAALVAWFSRRMLRARSRHWQIVTGTIEGHTPLTPDRAEPPRTVGYLLYSYRVDSDYYSGELPVTRKDTSLSLDELKHAIPAGTPVEVRYNPDDPEISVATMPHVQPAYAASLRDTDRSALRSWLASLVGR